MSLGTNLHYAWLAGLAALIVWAIAAMVLDRLSRVRSSPPLVHRYSLIICLILAALGRFVAVALELHYEAPHSGFQAWKVFACQSIADVFVLLTLRYVLVYVRQMHACMEGVEFHPIRTSIVVAVVAPVLTFWMIITVLTYLSGSYDTYYMSVEGGVGGLFVLLTSGAVYLATVLCKRPRALYSVANGSSDGRGAVEMAGSGYGTMADDDYEPNRGPEQEAIEKLSSRTNALHALSIIASALKAAVAMANSTGLLENEFGFPATLLDSPGNRLLYSAVSRFVVDELPCMVILILLRGMVPLSTKVLGSIKLRTLDEKYQRAVLSRRNRARGNLSFDDHGYGSDGSVGSSTSGRRREGLMGILLTGRGTPIDEEDEGVIDSEDSSDEVVSSAAAPKARKVPYPLQLQALERLRQGVLLPSPTMRASAGTDDAIPLLGTSDDEARTYNSDPDMPSSFGIRKQGR